MGRRVRVTEGKEEERYDALLTLIAGARAMGPFLMRDAAMAFWSRPSAPSVQCE